MPRFVFHSFGLLQYAVVADVEIALYRSRKIDNESGGA
jgi:hypothetical protein